MNLFYLGMDILQEDHGDMLFKNSLTQCDRSRNTVMFGIHHFHQCATWHNSGATMCDCSESVTGKTAGEGSRWETGNEATQHKYLETDRLLCKKAGRNTDTNS